MRGIGLTGLAVLLAFIGFGSNSGSAKPPETTAMAGKKGRTQQIDPAMAKSGRSLFLNRCARCHSLPRLSEHPAAAWPGIVDKMAKRSGLKPGQREAVLAYIQTAPRS